MRKPQPVTAADLGIEPITQYRAATEPYFSKTDGAGARLLAISLPRVRWLDRPDETDEPDDDALTAAD